MTENQKLREVFEARMTDNGKWPRAVEQGRNGCYLLTQTENAWAEWQACAEALALPTADHLPDAGKMIETAAPVDEREAFEALFRERYGWDTKDFKRDSRGDYMDGSTVTAWMSWQARAALQSSAYVRDAERYRMVRRGQYWSVVNGIGDHLRGEVLDARIDAAIRARSETSTGAA